MFRSGIYEFLNMFPEVWVEDGRPGHLQSCQVLFAQKETRKVGLVHSLNVWRFETYVPANQNI